MRSRDIAIAATGAGVLSGLPSTVFGLLTGRSVLEAARAAGTVLPGRHNRPGLLAGATAHIILSCFWATVIAVIRPRRPLQPLEGAALGLGIAALDLGVLGRRYPAIRALPQAPQWLDHLMFGGVAAAILRSRGRDSPS